MRRLLALFLLSALPAWAQADRGLLVVFTNSDAAQAARHQDMVELLKKSRAEGHFQGNGIEKNFQIYNYGERDQAATLARLKVPKGGTYICLTKLDDKKRPVKVLWQTRYSSPSDALTALDQQLGLTAVVVSKPPDLPPPDVRPPDPPPVQPPPSPAAPADNLSVGAEMNPGDMLESLSKGFRFVCQNDGNCVLYRVRGTSMTPTWATETQGMGVRVVLNGRGKLSVLGAGGATLWSTKEDQPGDYQLQLQEDGNLVIYRRQGSKAVAVWAAIR